MLDGWYCRSIANNNADMEDDEDDSPDEEMPNYKDQYRNLKRKLKFLIYENECFQEALRSTQRKLLKVNRDKSFLLDRLLQYEKVDNSFSESDVTESSEDENIRIEPVKKKKLDNTLNHNNMNNSTSQNVSTIPINSTTIIPTIQTPPTSLAPPQLPTTINTTINTMTPTIKPISTSKKKKITTPKQQKVQNPPIQTNNPPMQTNNISSMVSMMSDGHMTPEEVERHLESRQTYLELVPEKAPPTVPTEMFSNDPSLDSESNDIGELEASPSHLGDDCLSADMMAE